MEIIRTTTNNNGDVYTVCSHVGCSKKADWAITDHDCCGKCTAGRAHKQDAMANYAGPGDFAHRFHDTVMNPGVCMTCNLGREVH